MPNQMQIKGAQPSKPVKYTPMWTGRFFSGIITQRSPLRGNITRLEEAYFGGRGDEMISGLNTEISPKLTLIRRPGLSPYNSNSLPAVNRFYEFRELVNGTEGIKVLGDFAPQFPDTFGTVKDVTGPLVQPSTLLNPGNNITLWNKTGVPAVSGITNFQSVGDTLYASDLTSAHKWLLSTVSWTASSTFNQDQFIVDVNNNLQLNIGGQTATISNIQISGYLSGSTGLIGGTGYTTAPVITISGGNGSGATATCTVSGGAVNTITITNPGSGYTSLPTFTFTGGGGTSAAVTAVITGDTLVLFFSSTTPLTVPTQTALTLSGLTAVPALNGQTVYASSIANVLQITAPFAHSIVAYTTETGAATTGTGITGSTPPVSWGTMLGSVTADGGAQWENRGSAIQNWGITPPAVAPSVTQVDAPGGYSSWSANTWYAPLFVILDSNNNLQQLTTAGTTSTTAHPTWATTAGAGTNDNNGGPATGYAVWTCMGPATWQANHAYALGALVQATYTYYITVTGYNGGCFTLNTRINTLVGATSLGEVRVGNWVWNGRRFVRVKEIHDHDYDGELCHMGNDEWVTPEHLLGSDGSWEEAQRKFTERKHFNGTVRTLTVDADDYDEQAFELSNGELAHNKTEEGTYTYQKAVTVTGLYQCTTAGTSGSTAPKWTNGLNTTVSGDGGVTWTNKGTAPVWPGITQKLTLSTIILDSNNNLQTVQTIGESGPGPNPPTWLTAAGSATVDNNTSWLYSGAFAAANTGAWIYAYSGENSISGAISTASPESPSVIQNSGQQVVVQGSGFADLQVDTIILWRTVQGGSTLFYLGTIPNPSVTASATSFYIASDVAYVNAPNSFSAGQSVYLQSFRAGSYFNSQTVEIVTASSAQYSFAFTHADMGSVGSPIADTTGTATFAGTWIYTDTTPDTSLNILIEAPIDMTNNPPPAGLQALTYHLQRVWGAVGNLVYFSDGPDVISGNGNEAWSPSNVFAYPETVVRLFPTSSGLIIFTLSDVYIIQGLGTASSPLTSLPLLQDVGLSSYDAFDVNGSIVYMYTSDNQIVSLDPSSGVSEIGFGIGDQFGLGNGTGTFTPTTSHLTWHIAGSKDKGLYVSDFYGNWWRMCPTPSPETGVTWSPIANFIPTLGGFSAVKSVETSPGTHLLLVGAPNGSTGPILERDYSVHTDNGVAYDAHTVIGSLVLAQPGQIALVESLTTDSIATGTPLSLAVQLDEIAPVSAGLFEGLLNYVPDPTELSPSSSLYAQRFYLSQTQQPALCRHLQVQVKFGMDKVQNELLSMTLFGGFEQEK